MDNKLVSILIPVYNRENLIEETVQSALNQTYDNIEIIIVDNKSTDNTWGILQRLASQDDRIKIFQNETNIGPVRNWKRCLDEANGQYGKILWSDDLIAEEFVEKTVPFLKDKQIGFVFTRTELFCENTNKRTEYYSIGNTSIYENNKFINGALFSSNYPRSPGCALFRLDDLKNNLLIDIPNSINSDFSMHAIGNDLLIFLLIANKYKNFVFVNETLSYFRAHDSSISAQGGGMKLELFYDLAKGYFVENHRKDLIEKLNAFLWLHLRRFPNSKDYKLEAISDFYNKNINYKIDKKFLLYTVYKKMKDRLF